MARRRSRARRDTLSASRTENRIGMIAILAVVSLLFAVLMIEGFHLRERMVAGEMRRAQLEEAIEEEQLRTKAIEETQGDMDSDEFIRQAARDHLGLVEDGEIIFRRSDG